MPEHKLTVYCLCLFSPEWRPQAAELWRQLSATLTRWDVMWQQLHCSGRIRCRHKELLNALCSLQNIRRKSCSVHSTEWSRSPPRTLYFWVSFLLDVHISPLSFPAAVPTRGLWLLECFFQPVSPSFISPSLPFMVVPPVCDGCHCFWPIQLI